MRQKGGEMEKNMEGIIYDKNERYDRYYSYSCCVNGVHFQSNTVVVGDKGHTTYCNFHPCDGKCKRTIMFPPEVLEIMEKVLKTGKPQEDEFKCVE